LSLTRLAAEFLVQVYASFRKTHPAKAHYEPLSTGWPVGNTNKREDSVKKKISIIL
jgi:hypothetical protein